MDVINSGALVISLDFELFWGVADIANYIDWEEKIKHVYEIVPRTLSLFKKYDIHATWATVAAMMLNDVKELYGYLPKKMPKQTEEILTSLSLNNQAIPSYMLFANELVKQVYNTPGQELGTHTLTHYYCGRKDSRPEELAQEIKISSEIMKEKGYGLCKTIVFPRNQVKDEFIKAMPSNIKIYRGVKDGIVTAAKKRHPKLGVLLWYLDHYLPIQDATVKHIKIQNGDTCCNIIQSRLFKAYRNKYKLLEGIKMKRYKNEMTHAAKKHRVYHMCWHPHNFSVNTEENFSQLEELLDLYRDLKTRYNMRSYNMSEYVEMMKATE